MTVLLGLLAGALTTGAWLPQLRRTWRIGRADDISWAYLAAFGTGIALWAAYGIVEGEAAIIVANVVTLVLVAGLVWLKSHPRAHPPPSQGAVSPVDAQVEVVAGDQR